ncbi:isocitrate lyase/phosphoenolpyruvate mutase family protein [uncultured Roseobacter sp.]|uniref:isocitrate lyase/PEP mutase family protein n=1 Tax=uncultured Roseobacter sp. TaxID=114847 RepID=UPI002613CF68|nr:isocitrate lyase/phosphoenolpyruvate mutase family protein [uncultured Roseobacter sp.]
MSQAEKARLFKGLHVAGQPVVLYNIWDAGGAHALDKAGAKAIATGSWSVAAAHGYKDGEAMPLDFALMIVERIAQSTDLPLTVDFEGGYAEDPDQIEKNVSRVIAAGAVGINFEDQIVKGAGLYTIPDQVARIEAARRAADTAGIPLFVNARTDVFLKAGPDGVHADLMDDALARQAAYTAAGADGIFVPGLTDGSLIRTICEEASLPVNVMMRGALKSVEEAAQFGVARVSFGPRPYAAAVEDLTARFNAI